MPRPARKPKRPATRNREATRAAILKAALEEFAQEGLAGARTDAIARAARVNKALLYYYFHDKESLYGAVLDQVFGGLAAALNQVLDGDLPPREKVLAYAGTHFDYIAQSPFYPRLVQREMMRAGRGGSPHIRRLAERHLRPLFLRLGEVLRAGIAAGDFRAVEPLQFVVTAVGAIVFYFISAPMLGAITGADPREPQRIAARRAAVLDHIAAVLFQPAPGPGMSASKRGRK